MTLTAKRTAIAVLLAVLLRAPITFSGLDPDVDKFASAFPLGDLTGENGAAARLESHGPEGAPDALISLEQPLGITAVEPLPLRGNLKPDGVNHHGGDPIQPAGDTHPPTLGGSAGPGPAPGSGHSNGGPSGSVYPLPGDPAGDNPGNGGSADPSPSFIPGNSQNPGGGSHSSGNPGGSTGGGGGNGGTPPGSDPSSPPPHGGNGGNTPPVDITPSLPHDNGNNGGNPNDGHDPLTPPKGDDIAPGGGDGSIPPGLLTPDTPLPPVCDGPGTGGNQGPANNVPDGGASLTLIAISLPLLFALRRKYAKRRLP